MPSIWRGSGRQPDAAICQAFNAPYMARLFMAAIKRLSPATNKTSRWSCAHFKNKATIRDFTDMMPSVSFHRTIDEPSASRANAMMKGGAAAAADIGAELYYEGRARRRMSAARLSMLLSDEAGDVMMLSAWQDKCRSRLLI